MKSKKEIEKWMRDEISNPIIGKMITDMLETGISYEDVMQMIKPVIDNTPNVERKLVKIAIRKERQKEGDSILRSVFNKKK
jgi:hypothetical protein